MRYAWVRPLLNKTMRSVADAFDQILKSMPVKPFYIQSDKGTEFTGRDFGNVLKKYGISYFTTENDDSWFMYIYSSCCFSVTPLAHSFLE